MSGVGTRVLRIASPPAQAPYTADFVENWDDLIGWEGREDSESRFFHRILDAYGFEHVADIATGTGFNAVKLAQAGFKVTATDGAAAMIEKTVANAHAHGVALYDVRVADWLELHKVCSATTPSMLSSTSATPSPTCRSTRQGARRWPRFTRCLSPAAS